MVRPLIYEPTGRGRGAPTLFSNIITEWNPYYALDQLALWYSGSDLVMSGTKVIGMTDLSGNGRHAASSGAPSGSALTALDWNGHEAVKFSTVSSTSIKVPISGDDFKAIFVTLENSSFDMFTIINGFNGYAGVLSVGPDPITSGVTDPEVSVDGVTGGYSRADLLAASIDGTVMSCSGTFPTAGDEWNSPLTIADSGFSGMLGDVIMFKNTPSEDTVLRTQGYLAWRRGIQDKLPLTHPYKNKHPLV